MMSWRVVELPKLQRWAVRVSSDVSVRPKAKNSDQKPFTSSQEYCLADPLQAACQDPFLHICDQQGQ